MQAHRRALLPFFLIPAGRQKGYTQSGIDQACYYINAFNFKRNRGSKTGLQAKIICNGPEAEIGGNTDKGFVGRLLQVYAGPFSQAMIRWNGQENLLNQQRFAMNFRMYNRREKYTKVYFPGYKLRLQFLLIGDMTKPELNARMSCQIFFQKILQQAGGGDADSIASVC